MSKVFRVTLEVDEAWLDVLRETTDEVYDGEVCEWIEVKERVDV